MVGFAGPHVFVPADQVAGEHAELGGAEARHLATVLRARAGDPVSAADGAGTCWQARVGDGATPDRVPLVLTERALVPRLEPALTVVHALPKGRKLDGVVQRLVEIGVARLVPVHSERSQVRLEGARATKAVTRWRAVALAAAKQSRRAWLPEIAEVGEWTTAWPAGQAGVVLWEEATIRLRAVLPGPVPDALLLGIGPEGGLTAAEIAVTGLPAASLGPTVLRTETAALVAATAVLTLAGSLA